MLGKIGAGEGIRTLDPNVGKREIATSPQCVAVQRSAVRGAGRRGSQCFRTPRAMRLQQSAVNCAETERRQEANRAVTTASPSCMAGSRSLRGVVAAANQLTKNRGPA